jgi:sulfur carrier protein
MRVRGSATTARNSYGTIASENNVMIIRLNGDPHEIQEPLSVSALLTALDIDPRRVAVELNLTVVKKAAYESAVVKEGDEVEIVNFVGGG